LKQLFSEHEAIVYSDIIFTNLLMEDLKIQHFQFYLIHEKSILLKSILIFQTSHKIDFRINQKFYQLLNVNYLSIKRSN